MNTTTEIKDQVVELRECHDSLADLRMVGLALESTAANLYMMFGESPIYMKVEGLINRLYKAEETISKYVNHDITRQLHRSQEATGNMLKALLVGTQMGREEAQAGTSDAKKES